MLLFSATYAEDVKKFAMKIVPHACKIEVKKEDLTLSTIWQTYIDVGKLDENQQKQTKFSVLSDL